MKQIFTFNRFYFLLTVILFIVEVFIAKYVHDSIIRPYGGDFLVVILIYCFVKSFVDTPFVKTAIGVLLFAFFIEILQLFHIVDKLGLGHIKLARIIIGTAFSWEDILVYTLGILTVVLVEYFIRARQVKE